MTVITEDVPRAVAQTDLTRIEEALGSEALAKPTGGTQRFGTPSAKLPTLEVVEIEKRDDTAETVGQGAAGPARPVVQRRNTHLRVKSNTQTRRGSPRPFHEIDTESRPRKVNEGRERTPSHSSLQEVPMAAAETIAAAAAAKRTAQSDTDLLGNVWGRIPTAHRMAAAQPPAETEASQPLLPLSWPLVAFLGSSAAIGAIYYLLLNG